MVKDLPQLLRENVAAPPSSADAAVDIDAVLGAGRRRVRRRRTLVLSSTVAAATCAVVGGGVLVGDLMSEGADGPGIDTSGTPLVLEPVGPVLTLGDARRAVEGRDYTVLQEHENTDLERANGQYFDGVTDDGLLLFRDGPTGVRNLSTVALVDPTTGEKDWLPDPMQVLGEPISATADRLIYSPDLIDGGKVTLPVFDRTTRTWSSFRVSGFPRSESPMPLMFSHLAVGPDNRLYVGLMGDDAEHVNIWSVALDNPTDVRDENIVAGDFDVTGDELTWTATRNGPNSSVSIRDLSTGRETTFDPMSGDQCNQLRLDRVASYVVLGQYCAESGDGADNVRDDRVQIVTTTGEPVATIQGTYAEPTGLNEAGVVVSAGPAEDTGGTYFYDFSTGELSRISQSTSRYALATGPTPDTFFMWHTPSKEGKGAAQMLGRWLD